ncbi:glycosyltransferase family 9 protein [Desertivirga arenae]|uniref:glycosyltransferase family 9 protein n=1 Tax=Desertivirga arenae TaxID=2810309 RepID=UPI001A96E8AE|nr:glycosyltransferase family 9 protein [Pedobacter sp. SYSU D00823]
MILPITQVKKIAIFRALQLGDLLCSIPAIRALRSAYPDAEISLIGLPWAKSLLVRFPDYLDRFIDFPGYPGLPEREFSPAGFAKFLSGMVEENFDLVLQMQGNGNLVNPMVELFGPKTVAGFFKEGVYVPEGGYFIPYPENLHEIDRHIALISSLGIDDQGRDLEFPLYEQDYDDLRKAELPIEKGKYVCIHPGSRETARQWPAEYFAALGDLAADQGLTPVITGTSDELNIVADVVSRMKSEAVIAAGKTSLGAVAVLIKQAHSLVSNCTGVAHIAAALKVPSIVISLNTDPKRWEPLNKDLHKTIEWIYNPDLQLIYSESKNLFQQKLSPLNQTEILN